MRDAAALRAAMAIVAAYLKPGELREPSHYTPEMSRRARGVELWATLRSLGRSGLSDLIERTCRHARRFAEGLRAAGHEILNDVVINQVLVSFGEPAVTRAVIAKDAGRRYLLVRRHGVARASGDAHQRVFMGHDRGRRGNESGGDLPCREGIAQMTPDWKRLRAEFPALAELDLPEYGHVRPDAARRVGCHDAAYRATRRVRLRRLPLVVRRYGCDPGVVRAIGALRGVGHRFRD